MELNYKSRFTRKLPVNSEKAKNVAANDHERLKPQNATDNDRISLPPAAQRLSPANAMEYVKKLTSQDASKKSTKHLDSHDFSSSQSRDVERVRSLDVSEITIVAVKLHASTTILSYQSHRTAIGGNST